MGLLKRIIEAVSPRAPDADDLVSTMQREVWPFLQQVRRLLNDIVDVINSIPTSPTGLDDHTQLTLVSRATVKQHPSAAINTDDQTFSGHLVGTDDLKEAMAVLDGLVIPTQTLLDHKFSVDATDEAANGADYGFAKFIDSSTIAWSVVTTGGQRRIKGDVSGVTASIPTVNYDPSVTRKHVELVVNGGAEDVPPAHQGDDLYGTVTNWPLSGGGDGYSLLWSYIGGAWGLTVPTPRLAGVRAIGSATPGGGVNWIGQVCNLATYATAIAAGQATVDYSAFFEQFTPEYPHRPDDIWYSVEFYATTTDANGGHNLISRVGIGYGDGIPGWVVPSQSGTCAIPTNARVIRFRIDWQLASGAAGFTAVADNVSCIISVPADHVYTPSLSNPLVIQTDDGSPPTSVVAIWAVTGSSPGDVAKVWSVVDTRAAFDHSLHDVELDDEGLIDCEGYRNVRITTAGTLTGLKPGGTLDTGDTIDVVFGVANIFVQAGYNITGQPNAGYPGAYDGYRNITLATNETMRNTVANGEISFRIYDATAVARSVQ